MGLLSKKSASNQTSKEESISSSSSSSHLKGKQERLGSSNSSNNSSGDLLQNNESSPLLDIRKHSSASSSASSTYRKKQQHRRLIGLSLMALSAIGFSLMTLCVKLLSAADPPIPSWEIVFVRSVIQLGLSLGCLIGWNGINPFGPPGYRILLMCRGLCGALGMACFFYGITQLSLADATVIFFSNPILTVFMAWLLLGEPLHSIDVLVGFVCFTGVTFVARPSFLFHPHSANGNITGDDDNNNNNNLQLQDNKNTEQRVFAVLITLLGALMAASAYIIVRKIGHNASFMTSVFAFGFVSSLISPVGLYIFQSQAARVPEARDWYTWTLLILTGLLAFAAQCLLNKGLQMERAGPATLMRNLDTVFAFVFDLTILHHTPNVWSVCGAALILSATVGLGLYRYCSAHR